MEKRREDKKIVFTIPRSQWVHRRTRLIKERVLSVMKRNKMRSASHHA